MKIFGICVVKNEDDVVQYTLRCASKWCHRIFVYDTGSTDATWERVLELSRDMPQIVPFKQQKVPFSDSLRAEIFNYFRKEVNHLTDWWVRLDSDEVYIDSPTQFLSDVSRHDHVVWGVSFQYYFTEVEKRMYEGDPQGFDLIGLEQRMMHYRADWSESRFFRHRRNLIWTTGPWPYHLGIVSERRIRLKHFQYRSPAQIEKRLRTRQEASREGWRLFDSYSSGESWRDKVVSSGTCMRDYPGNPYNYDAGQLPSHLESHWRRLVRRTMHSVGVWP